jgi:hypothetical protein
MGNTTQLSRQYASPRLTVLGGDEAEGWTERGKDFLKFGERYVNRIIIQGRRGLSVLFGAVRQMGDHHAVEVMAVWARVIPKRKQSGG